MTVSEATSSIAATLGQTVQDEELELRKLRSSLLASFTLTTSTTPTTRTRTGTPSPADSSSPAAFDAFELRVVESDSKLHQAIRDLAEIQEGLSPAGQTLVNDFSAQHDSLLQAWNKFHREYDEWLRTEGGCDRAKTVETLAQFNIRFAELTNKVRSLSRASFLRPIGELLVDAAEREERSLRSLRNNWHPFDVEVYKNLDQERLAVARLQRQASVGLQDLLEQYGISP